MSKKHIVFTVTNALNGDQRMQRICTSLVQAGYRVTLVGWEYPDSKPLTEQAFEQVRLPMRFRKGKLRYAEYNWKLWKALPTLKPDIIGAIDLDTIIPCLKVAQKLKVPITYDAHEYFTELEEIVRRPFVHWVWRKVEEYAVPKIMAGYAVSDAYVALFKEKYGVEYTVIRNATVKRERLAAATHAKPIVLYQGAVNEGRALDQVILAMQHIDAELWICGVGDLYESLQDFTREQGLQEKVHFKGFVAPANLRAITADAAVGLTLFETNGKSNYYSLANRFFDYMHAGVPQVCNAYPEYVKINAQFPLALLIESPTAALIAEAVNNILKDATLAKQLHEGALAAREVYNWQEEEKKLVQIYSRL